MGPSLSTLLPTGPYPLGCDSPDAAQVTQRLNHCTTADDMRSLLVGGLPKDTVALAGAAAGRAQRDGDGDGGRADGVLRAALRRHRVGDRFDQLIRHDLRPQSGIFWRDWLPNCGRRGIGCVGADRFVALRPAAQRSFPVCYFVMHRGQMPVHAAAERRGRLSPRLGRPRGAPAARGEPGRASQ